MKKSTLFLGLFLIFSAYSFNEVAQINTGPVRAIDGIGDVVFAGVGGSLNIYNIYRRDFPQLMHTMSGLSSDIKDIIVDEESNKLYLLAEKEGLFILNITEPYRPVLLGHISAGEEKLSTMDFDGASTLYIGGSNFVSEVDVSNPAAIFVKKSVNLPDTPLSVDYHAGRLYLAMGDDGLIVLGTSREDSFMYMGTQKGTYTLVCAYGTNILYGRLDKPKEDEERLFNQIFTFPFFHPVTAKVSDKVIYSGGLNNFAIYQLSEISNTDPKLVWNLPNMPTLDCVLKDDNIYLANDFQGLSVYQVSDIRNPVEIGRVKTLGRGQDVFVHNDILYIPSGLSGTARYDITDTEHPVQLDVLPSNLTSCFDIVESNNKLYVLGARNDFPNNIFVEKVCPNTLIIEEEYPITSVLKPQNISAIEMAEGYAVITLGTDELFIFDSEFEQISSITESGAQFYRSQIRNSFLYVSDFHGTYHIYRLGENPEWVSSLTTFAEGGNGFVLDNDYIVSGDATNGLSIIDIANPKTPTLLANYPSVWGMDVVIDNEIAYLADGKGRLKAFDISDPAVPTLLDTLSHSGYFTDLCLEQDYIIANDIYHGIYIYNTLESDEPLAKAGLDTNPIEIGITGNYPNPFNSATDINIVLTEKTDVDFAIHNIRGEKVETLMKETLPSGSYKITWKPENQASGVYLAVLKTPAQTWKRQIKYVK